MRQRGGAAGAGGGGSVAGLPLYHQGDTTPATTPTNNSGSGISNNRHSNSSRTATRQRRRTSDNVVGAGDIASTTSRSWEINTPSSTTSDDEKDDIEAGGQRHQRTTRRRPNNHREGGQRGLFIVDSGDHFLTSENDMDKEGDYDELDLKSDHEQPQKNVYYPAPLSNQRHPQNQQQQQQSALSFHSLSNWQQQQQHYQNGLYQQTAANIPQQFYQKQMHQQQQQQHVNLPQSPSSSSSLMLRRLHQSNLSQHPYSRGSNASLQDFHTVYRTPLHVPDNLYHEYIMSGSSSLSLSSLGGGGGGLHNTHQQQQQRLRYMGHGGYNTVRRRQGRSAGGRGGGRRKAPPMVTRSCFASCCGGFSAVASIFLVFVGILLDTQPLLIKGSLHQQVLTYSSNDMIFGGGSSSSGGAAAGRNRVVKRYLVPNGKDGERLPSAHAAYQASLAYFVVVLLCWYVSNPTWINARIYRLRNKYQDIPDDHTSSVSSNLPTFHAHDGNSGADSSGDSEAERGNVISAAYHQGFLGGAAYLWRRFTNYGRQWLASRGWFYSYAPASRRRRKYSTKRDV